MIGRSRGDLGPLVCWTENEKVRIYLLKGAGDVTLDGWSSKTIGELCNFSNGYGFRPSDWSKEEITSQVVPFPPLCEQQKIVPVLSNTDSLIESLDRLIAKKRDIKQATMQQLLTGKTRLPEFRGEWEVKMLGEITQSTAGGTP